MSDKYHQIGKNYYLIKSKEKDFHRNIYLKRFIGNGQTLNMLMDPGTQLDVPVLVEVLKELIGGIQNVNMIFLSHQDPDVTSNCNTLLTAAPRAIVMASIDTWRLIRMYGISEKRFFPVENTSFRKINLRKTGHRLQFVPARFCHFRGAMMLHDIESSILFSGDFMGGVNSRKDDQGGFVATEHSWSGISTFHQIYMPSRYAIRETVDKIGLLDPLPRIIAPQHGDLIPNTLLGDFLGRIANLDVGIELEKSLKPEGRLVVRAINQFLESFQESYPDLHAKFIKMAAKGGEFTSPLKLSGNTVTDISIRANEAFLFVWNTVKKVIPDQIADEVKTLFIITLDDLNLSVPAQISTEMEEFSTDIF